jgi:hypothetical protein
MNQLQLNIVQAIPATFILDASGNSSKRFKGDELRAKIEELLAK